MQNFFINKNSANPLLGIHSGYIFYANSTEIILKNYQLNEKYFVKTYVNDCALKKQISYLIISIRYFCSK